jgi:hypothetical protein
VSVEHLVIGPPGTGKTTYLARQATRAAQTVGSESVMIASLTRAAAQEIAGRDTPIPRRCVGTLHAHAYRALDKPELAETPEGLAAWNEYAKEQGLVWKIGTGASMNLDYAPEQRAEGQGEALLAAMGTLRAKQAPRELWPPKVLRFAEAWEAWKAKTERLDFTDLIEKAFEDVDQPPTAPKIMMLDEAQDLSALEFGLARKWAESCEQIVVVGDPDQCQPPNTLVETTDGPVRIAELDSRRHRLLSYDRRSSVIVGRRDGYGFEIESHQYAGEMVLVGARGSSSRSTPEHLWPIRWKSDTRANVTYLMRQGDRWRIGWCQLFGKEGAFHLGRRAELEKAGAAWILGVHMDKRGASIEESALAAQYGLPTICFEPRAGRRGYMDRGCIDAVFESLSPDQQASRAAELLRDFGRQLRFPIWDRESKHMKRGKRTSWTVRACNLISDLMMVAVCRGERTCLWWPAAIYREGYVGDVYSLKVEPHQTYIADQIVTHNCLYQWRGTDPAAMLAGEISTERVLAQSYRVPEAVHEYAVGWIEGVEGRLPVEYEPRLLDPRDPSKGHAVGAVQRAPSTFRDPEGMVRRVLADVEEGKTVMILGSCGYMLDPTIAVLKRQGVPFWNPYRVTHGGWNPLRGARRLLAFLRHDSATWGDEARDYTWTDVRAWAEKMRAKGVFDRGAKDFLVSKARRAVEAEKLGEEEPTINPDSLEGLFVPDLAAEHMARVLEPDVDWWAENLLADAQKSSRYPVSVYHARGGAALRERPQIVIGTIHSVKGGQADSVYVFPDLSHRGWASGWERPASRAPTYRLFYVAFTRAREKLTVCEAAGGEAAALPVPER